MLIPSRLQKILSFFLKKILEVRYQSKIGSSTQLHFTVKIINPNRTVIGNNVFIGKGCYIDSSDQVSIGDNTLIAPMVFICSRSHQYDRREDLIREQGYKYAPVTIGNDCWIGYGAKIMPGVTIKEGAVVAAGSVVTKTVQPYEVVGGVPAKTIGMRN